MNRPALFPILSLAFSLLLVSNSAFADTANGIIKLKSRYSVSETINRLEEILSKKGMTIFRRVDHTAGAKKVGLDLRPTQLLIFGNPKVGTPLMQCAQTAALDLPQKALAWQDESGQVWLAYNDPAYMAKRHDIEGCDKAVLKVTGALEKFTAAAVK